MESGAVNGSKDSKPLSKCRKKNQSLEGIFRHDLDLCSSKKDLSKAISLYEFALSNSIHLNLYHFNVLLYICSNTATESESLRDSAIQFGFRVFNHVLSSNVNPTEATITAAARLTAAKGDGDAAFDLLKTMPNYNITPKLRSYSPVLICYCRSLEAEKAYGVEEHMVLNGVNAEEPELMALLKLSVETMRDKKVYEYLHKLRASVRGVSEATLEIIESWFSGNAASDVSIAHLDDSEVEDAVSRNGGGWHGLGWIGKGRWIVRRGNIDSNGCCCCCSEQLVCVDTDRAETEKFAQSVASLAMKRESKSNFKDFQDWLNKHDEYGAIVDGANIGLYQQNFAEGGFSIVQLKSVVEELYKQNNKWPLVIMHKKRVRMLLENAEYRELVEHWMAKGVLYATPYGSNDDWYWLYAAVQFKCLIVTNDEMRDHIFELFGRNFFLRWKERHQVRYSFKKGIASFQMPPSYSIVIQESVKGSWHVPQSYETGEESSRVWLCITRQDSSTEFATTVDVSKDAELPSKSLDNGTTLINDRMCESSNPSHALGKRKDRS
ncbi:proteinaceous RNase P 2 [Impatiens glandulifera]|uniref:proteinaceous RNase P 2 n=1 Tax=Impatiens glandulifera TaxID=253017 RepID=UPI001FB1485A|nr:proteinaceous RNase P 2 [Impatiens glandulifera]XP_047317047.1 proteinaceous RNase P 2 [Impatiens glandulifera]